MEQEGTGRSNEQGRRGADRNRVLKGAQVIFGSSTLNCVVLDISVSGARVSLTSPAVIPEIVALRLRDGSTYPACRRWARGTEIGLEFTGRARASGDAGHVRRAWAALEAVRAADPTGWLQILRGERFFGDEALQRAAEAAEAAHMRLEAALRPHAAGEER
ncbi:MAG: hypothetical protein QJR07_21470 [Acetobacteraceae bacterium]|nr:hypothetical protein [Acetobacteraceae bacterium]MDI3309649.1 hypothetical protein [Acetobacteraceae bacterium]